MAEKEVYSITESQKFIEALDRMPDELIYKKVPLKFLILTGVRISELQGLRWSDIDFEHKVVHIQRIKDWFREADDKFDEHLDSAYIVSNVYRQPAGIGVVRQLLDKFEKGKSKKNSPYRYYAPPSLSKRLRYAV